MSDQRNKGNGYADEAETAPHAAGAGGAVVVNGGSGEGDKGGGGGGSRGGTSDIFFAPKPPPEPEPERIGAYRIVRRLGAGGMGLVYLGVRDDDKFHKRVAIKLIKKGMDSEEILRRFEQERQVLSALNHPNIARLLDGGSAADGRPYFVMEYIEGMPINEYCDKNRLGIEERLELFATLCRAVHYAHQNLIVHRDLKPGNVIITPNRTVKLLDFGIAKLLNPDLSVVASDPTRTALRLMTPEYASPEQVRGDPLSTASDIYSLGVLLFELVTGRRPYRFKTRMQAEIERIICNEDPEKPSTAISHVPDGEEVLASDPRTTTKPPSTVDEIARVRDVKPDRLRKRLSGDIDNMILLAMRKEPDRRYKSAEQFAEDIRRHLDGMPVIARPATWTYRLDKFVRRNKYGVAAGLAIAVTLVLGILATTSQMLRANTNARIAQQKQEEANQQREIAIAKEGEANAARDRSESLRRLTATSWLGLNNAIAKLSGSNEARELVVTTTLKYLKEFRNLAGETSDLQKELANGYVALGDLQGGLRTQNQGKTADAIESYQVAHELLLRINRENPNDVETKRALCGTHIRLGDLFKRGDDDEKALAEYQAAEAIAQAVVTTHADDLDGKRLLSTALLGIGDIHRSARRMPAAVQAYSRSHALRQELLAAQPNDITAIRDMTVLQSRLAEMLKVQGKFDDALKYYVELRATRQRLVELEPNNDRHKRSLAWADYFQGHLWMEKKDYTKAAGFFADARSVMQYLYDNDHANAEGVRDLSTMLIASGDVADARRRDGDQQLDANSLKQLGLEAINFYKYAEAILAPHVARDTADRFGLNIFANLHQNWGLVEESLGNRALALEHLAKARDSIAKLAAKDPDASAQLKSIEEALGRLNSAE
jgi:serine/threonine protein kinase/tetratricopeptide (TPR) repeat protein